MQTWRFWAPEGFQIRIDPSLQQHANKLLPNNHEAGSEVKSQIHHRPPNKASVPVRQPEEKFWRGGGRGAEKREAKSSFQTRSSPRRDEGNRSHERMHGGNMDRMQPRQAKAKKMSREMSHDYCCVLQLWLCSTLMNRNVNLFQIVYMIS